MLTRRSLLGAEETEPAFVVLGGNEAERRAP